MTDRDDLQPMLDELGRDEGPAVDGAFANRLEADLRSMHEDHLGGAGSPLRRRPIWVPAVAIAATVLAGAVAWSVARGNDGSAVDLVPATTPPRSAPSTPATAVDDAQAGSDRADSETTTTNAEPDVAAPDAGPSTTAEVADTARTSTTSVPARPSTTSTTAATAPTTTTTLASTSSTSAVDRPAIDLSITAIGADRLRLAWEPTDVVNAHAWRVEAVAGDRIATVAEVADPTARTATIARNDAADVSFRIVALDRAGEVIVESNTVDQPSRP